MSRRRNSAAPHHVAAGLAVAGAIALAVVCSGDASAQPDSIQLASSDRPDTLVIGRVARSARRNVKRVRKMARYIARRLREFGYEDGQAVITETRGAMIALMKQGKIDLISETAYGASDFVQLADFDYLLHEWKNGEPYYRTVFFAKKERGFKSLKDLRGKLVAFEDDGSTSAYFIPQVILHEAGLQTVQIRSIHHPRRPDRANFTFSQGEINQVTMVHNDIVDAGAFSDSDWRVMTKENSEFAKTMALLYTSRPIVRSLILIRKSIKPEVRKKITETLLKMDHFIESQNIIENYNAVSKYERLDDKARKILDWVDQQKRKLDSG